MKHELRKLYKFEGKIYSLDGLSKVVGVDLTQMTTREIYRMGYNRFFRVCNYNNSNRASFKYYTAEGEKIGWQFGEQTYFDTEAERDAERARCQAIREESKRRTELLKKISELDTETLEKIVNNL